MVVGSDGMNHKRCDTLRFARTLRLKERYNQRRRNKSHKNIYGHRFKHNKAYAKEIRICDVCGNKQ